MNQLRALEQLDLNIPACVDLFLQRLTPGSELIRPRFDREGPPADAIDRDRSVPTVGVAMVRQRGCRPLVVAGPLEQHPRCKLIVSFLEHVSADPDEIADDPLHRMPTGVQLGGNAVDCDSLEPARPETTVRFFGH